MKKLSKKLLLSILTVALTFIALGTSTFAWFAINNQVTATGMQVKTQVSDNLFIAPIDIDATAKNADTNFKIAHNFTADAALLEPVSTVDGMNFFYTDPAENVNPNGSAKTAVFAEYNTDAEDPDSDQLAAFNEANDTTGAAGYVDYVFELKAINASDDVKTLKLTDLHMAYNGVYVEEKAFRIAFFMQKFNGTAYTMVSSETLDQATFTTIFTKSGAAYFNSGQAVDSTSSRDDVSNLNQQISLNVPAGTTDYYKVVIRIWLEGEDTTCKNDTYASLNQNWSIDIKFVLGTATAVSYIDNQVVGSTFATNIGTVTLSEGKLSNQETPASYQWYDATGTAVSTGTGGTTYQYTAATAGNYYCKIITTKGTVYYTVCSALTAGA